MLNKLFLLILLLAGAYADGQLPIKDVYFLKDHDAGLTINEILQTGFTHKTTHNLTLGYTKGNVWLKFALTNRSSEETLILSLNETFYEVANLFYVDQDHALIEKRTGLFTPIGEREVQTNYLAFEVTIPKETTRTFYLQLHGKYAYLGNLTALPKSSFYRYTLLNINTLYLVVFGILIAIILFNLFLYLKMREKLYLYYVCYTVFSLVYMLNMSGMLVFLDLQKYIYVIHASAAFTMGFLILFSLEYLDTKKYLSAYDTFLKSLSAWFFFLGIAILFSYQPWNKFIAYSAALICILLIAISVWIYFKGHSKAKFYIVAMMLYFSFVIVWSMTFAGIFEYSNVTRYGLFFASAVESIIFALMLASRYSELKEETIESQSRLIRLKNQNEVFLTNEVELRTQKIKQDYERIQQLLGEKELLLKEVHHRVKNNFHMLTGLLWFEEQKDPAQADRLQGIKNRVKSMSMIHEKLYKSKDISHIALKEYLEEIVANLSASYKECHATVEQDIQDVTMDFEPALSLGVIVNEVLSNSLKHNEGQNDLHIAITLKEHEGSVTLSIRDNGKGLESAHGSNGIGMSLIENFARSLPSCSYTLVSENGTVLTLTFSMGKEASVES